MSIDKVHEGARSQEHEGGAQLVVPAKKTAMQKRKRKPPRLDSTSIGSPVPLSFPHDHQFESKPHPASDVEVPHHLLVLV